MSTVAPRLSEGSPVSLLLRAATSHDVDGLRRLLNERPIRPGERVVVLADVAAVDGACVRGVAVVREAPQRWLVLAAAVDDRWPPAASGLVDQLRASAIAQGAVALVFRPGCSADVLAEVLREATVDVGGAVTVAL